MYIYYLYNNNFFQIVLYHELICLFGKICKLKKSFYVTRCITRNHEYSHVELSYY